MVVVRKAGGEKRGARWAVSRCELLVEMENAVGRCCSLKAWEQSGKQSLL